MEKELRFKKEWFEVLDRCDRSLRMEVVEAVFRYFFTGTEPDFDDEARMLAFGFIRADIDAARRRRRQRLARKEQSEGKTGTAADVPCEPPTYEEKNYLCSLLHHWNDTVKDIGISPVKTTFDLDSEVYAPALRALRRLPYQKIYEAISRIRHDPSKPGFRQFFNGL